MSSSSSTGTTLHCPLPLGGLNRRRRRRLDCCAIGREPSLISGRPRFVPGAPPRHHPREERKVFLFYCASKQLLIVAVRFVCYWIARCSPSIPALPEGKMGILMWSCFWKHTGADADDTRMSARCRRFQSALRFEYLVVDGRLLVKAGAGRREKMINVRRRGQ